MIDIDAIFSNENYKEEVVLMKKDIYQASSEKFLEDVKTEIKWRYKNQQRFADSLYISRKALNRVLNNIEELTIYWIRLFCEKLGLDYRTYLNREKD